MADIDTIAGNKSGDVWKFIAQALLVVLMSAGGAFLTVESRISSKIESESPWAKDQAVVMESVNDVEDLEKKVAELRLMVSSLNGIKKEADDLKKEIDDISTKVTQLQVNGRALKETLDRVRSTEQTVTQLQVSNAALNAKLDQLLAKRNQPTPQPKKQ